MFYRVIALMLMARIALGCEPMNISITFGKMIDDPDTHEAWRVFFITQKPCNDARLVMTPFGGSALTFDFELIDVYRTSINEVGQTHRVPYLRFAYAASIPDVTGYEKFSYKIDYTTEDMSNSNGYKAASTVSIEFESHVYSIKHGSSQAKLKILAMADHKYNEGQKDVLMDQLAIERKKTKWDVMVMMGDYSYEIYDNYGLKGDKYFNLMQPYMGCAPIIMVGGNHEVFDFGRLLHFRMRFPQSRHADDNMLYYINLGNISFLVFNLDLYYWNTKTFQAEMKERMTELGNKSKQFITNQSKGPFRFFVTHRAFYCINRHLNDRCNLWPMMTAFEPILEKEFSPDVMLTGHKHLYQRLFKGDLADLPWFPIVDTPEKLKKNVLNVIVGTAGLQEHDLYDTPSESRIRYRNIYHTAHGYLLMEVGEDVSSTFYSIKPDGAVTVEDQFRFTKDRVLTEGTSLPAPFFKTALEKEVFDPANLISERRNVLTSV